MDTRKSQIRRDPIRSVALAVVALGSTALVYACADASSRTTGPVAGGSTAASPADRSQALGPNDPVTPGVVTLCKVGADGNFTVQIGVGATPTNLAMPGNTCRTITSVPPTQQDDVIVTITEQLGNTYSLDHIVERQGTNAARTITGSRIVSFEAVHGAIITYYNIAQLSVCKHGTAATFQYQIGLGQPLQSLSLADGECRPIGTVAATQQDDVIVTVRENASSSYKLDHMTLVQGVSAARTITGQSELSFEGAHGAVLSFYNVPVTAQGCTYTQGYYKNRGSNLLPSGTFYASGATYLEVLQTAPKGGNAYYILAHQFIAATVNAKSASVPTDVQNALDQAKVYFSTAGITPSSPYTTTYTQARLTAWADLLDRYNQGTVGPGHCKDE